MAGPPEQVVRYTSAEVVRPVYHRVLSGIEWLAGDIISVPVQVIFAKHVHPLTGFPDHIPLFARSAFSTIGGFPGLAGLVAIGCTVWFICRSAWRAYKEITGTLRRLESTVSELEDTLSREIAAWAVTQAQMGESLKVSVASLEAADASLVNNLMSGLEKEKKGRERAISMLKAECTGGMEKERKERETADSTLKAEYTGGLEKEKKERGEAITALEAEYTGGLEKKKEREEAITALEADYTRRLLIETSDRKAEDIHLKYSIEREEKFRRDDVQALSNIILPARDHETQIEDLRRRMTVAERILSPAAAAAAVVNLSPPYIN